MKLNISLTRISFVVIILTFFCTISCKQKEETNNDNSTTKRLVKTAALKKPLFSQVVATESGINFINYNKENKDFNYYNYEYFYNGGGVATADFNNDGLLDIVFTANMALNTLYLNKGNFKFEDITTTAGINSNTQDWCTGVNVIDINNDGFQDIFISRSGWFKGTEKSKLTNLLFINNGDLTFTESAKEYGFTDQSRSTQACFFDKDNDGDLDVYFINHPLKHASFKQSVSTGKLSYVDKGATYSDSDKLYENRKGKFIDITKSLGLQNVSHSLGVMSADLNNDGWQDLYIANDYSKPDHILINQKNGTFKNELLSAVKHMSKFSMGLDIADINNDGLVDIFNSEMLGNDNYSKKVNMAGMNPKLYHGYVEAKLHYQDMHNSLQLNNGNGTFSEIAWMANVAETDWSWSALFADFDNDGYKDLFVSNGNKRDVMNKDFISKVEKNGVEHAKIFGVFQNEIPVSKTYNYIFSNNGDLTFKDNTLEWGLKDAVLNTNGAAYADLDNDGDLDLILNNLEEKAVLYKNNSEENNYITLDLKNKSQNYYGAKISILDNGKEQFWELGNTSGFQSHSDSRVHFGIGNAKKVDSIVIHWPSDGTKLYTALEINTIHKLTAKGGVNYNNKKEANTTLFTNITNNIGVSEKHKEEDFDDYINEILLPHKLSQEGPFIAVADVNGDGLDDYYQGNGVGFAGVLYIQNTKGKFKKSKQGTFEKDKMSEDIGVLFFDYDNDGDQDLYVVSGSNEYELKNPLLHDRLYVNNGNGQFSKTKGVIPTVNASGSCVIANDIDNDGDLDLFIGGFQVPGQYPKAGDSQLLINNNGVYKNEIIGRAEGLINIGMVKDAIFVDINNDDQKDLIVVGHWMAIEVYLNKNGIFSNKSEAYGTKENVGWWNTITASDIDKDGKIDLLVGNLGTNTKHKATKEQPFVVMAKDFDGNGTNDIALGYYNNNELYPVRGLQCSAEQIPSIKYNVNSYSEFGRQTFEEIYNNFNTSNAIKHQATYFKSAYLKNTGTRFEYKSLPNKTQVAPTNSILVYDINNDGLDEIITVGNHYPVEVETGRYDAHTGAVFNSALKTINLKQSGLFNDKDARDIKTIIIKGKKHLMVSNNRERVQFFEIKD
ncbi:VCBS repeat-containing protein [Lacinutrix jangbogonensis]|uniref:VCBS repeat-containing protein n=1 Tax=Lacinutrix jangbogonensis TaxID=1469557 RepID=UPI00053EF28D|nr:VCBS repeat-containing protein [Lacinutrix jangbogonensis]